MGVEAVLHAQQAQTWPELTIKSSCAPRYFPVSHQWPAVMEGDMAWSPASFKSEDDYTLTLTEEEVSEVKAGLEHFNSRRP